jgi:serine phosphatase RsbU (regulator of sigma subunit)
MSIKEQIKTGAWPDPKDYPRSIRFHFSIVMGLIILALMAITGVIVSEKHASTVTEAVVERLMAQARSYSSSAGKHLLTANGPDVLMLNNICKKLGDESDDIHWAAVADSAKSMIAHTDVRKVASIGRLHAWQGTQEWGWLRPGEAYTVSGDTIRINVPIRERELVVGQLELAASSDAIHSARMQSLIAMGSITLVVLLMGLPLTTILTHRKLRPIAVITEHLRKTEPENPQIDIPLKANDEFGYLADTLRIMGEKVGRAQRETIERERMAKELEIAREIQAKILPKSFPAGNNVESFGFYESAKQVGGDYYDFIDLDRNRFAFLVADVSGKSLPGMLIMLLTRDIVRQAAGQITDPAELLKHVNRELRANIRRGMFVTMFFGVLNRNTGRFDFACAGHNPLFRLSTEGNSLSQYKPDGFPLGLMAPEQFDKQIKAENLTLAPGDILIQYTDGINEAQNGEQEEYGVERFVAALERVNPESTRDLVESIMAAHKSFVGSADRYDDITLVAVKWHPDVTDINSRDNCEAEYKHRAEVR